MILPTCVDSVFAQLHLSHLEKMHETLLGASPCLGL